MLNFQHDPMEPAPALPLSLDELPESLRRFCNPDGPAPPRMMAAKGLVPVRGNDQVMMLAQLANDPDKAVQAAASESLLKLPDSLLEPACSADLHPAILHHLCITLKNEELLGLLSGNPATPDESLLELAKRGSERLTERVAVNEVRLLQAPEVIEALYKNRNTRMSTADRLIDLAARNQVNLPGVPAYKDHVEALKGQLIPEPCDEPLPQDEAFDNTLQTDDEAQAGGDAFDRDKVTGAEAMKKQYKPLNMQIQEMSKAEKLRMALIGSLGARQILVRDNSKQVAMAAITSPQVTVGEAADVAKSKEVTEEILRFIGSKKEWVKAGEIKHNLVFNPKTPVGISLKFIGHLRLDELRTLAKSRNVPAQIKGLAAQWVVRREKK